MPKDYRDRRIDDQPPRLRTVRPAGTTTQVDPDDGVHSGDMESDGEAYVPPMPSGVLVGDAVLWFLSLPAASAPPSGRNAVLKTKLGAAVTHSYSALPSGWTNYITSFAGNTVYQQDGITISSEKTVYVIFDQFASFTPGDYNVAFTVPTGGTIERAIYLRGVNPANPGTFYAGMSQSPTWSVTYSGMLPEDKVDNLPRTFTLPATGTPHLIYGIYQMSGMVEAPAALWSTPGVMLLSYTLQNPADQPYFKRSIVTLYGNEPATITTLQVLAPFENGWAGAF